MNTVVVLGMHRSGTSLVAKILHTIGISMGQEFLDADDAN
ncbi:MAG TPA: sulfotransferase family protein, partial [Maribacter sp.]|nr:sulfotransferase family protein [Maribacter sp.]